MPHTDEILLNIYHECAQYSREQSKKRDGFITTYLLIYSGYIALFSSNNPLPDYIAIGIGILMAALGFLFSLIIISYNCWEIQYVQCARAISAFLLENAHPTDPRAIKERLWAIIREKKSQKTSFFYGAGNTVTTMFIVVSSTPIFILLNWTSYLPSWLKLTGMCTYMAIYIVTILAFMHYRVNEARLGEYKDKTGKVNPIWIIDFYN